MDAKKTSLTAWLIRFEPPGYLPPAGELNLVSPKAEKILSGRPDILEAVKNGTLFKGYFHDERYEDTPSPEAHVTVVSNSNEAWNVWLALMNKIFVPQNPNLVMWVHVVEDFTPKRNSTVEDAPASSSISGYYYGWFKIQRSDETMELLKVKPNAFLLLTLIAARARWKDKFDAHDLNVDEAYIGRPDHKQCGLSAQEYRTALTFLVKHRFITIRPTNKGTIARLVDTRVFDVSPTPDNHQSNQRATSKQPAANHQITTNEERRKEKKGVNIERLGSVELKAGSKRTIELMAECKEVLGMKEMELHHARWLKRADDEPDKLRRILADTRATAREDGLTNPAAWAETLWKDWRPT